ncbi:hypothetical protein DVH05_010173 [Phytophthora capsici]|nr:hypothetical protein DVH05_010173 [Phytophthora capsici]
MQITSITTNAQLKAHRATHGNQLLTGDVLGVRIQFTNTDKVFAVVVADTSPTPNVVILGGLTWKQRAKVLKQLLESSAVKVIYDTCGLVQSLEQYIIKKKCTITPRRTATVRSRAGLGHSQRQLNEISSHFCGSEVNDLIQKVEILKKTHILVASSPKQEELMVAAAQLLGKCYLASLPFVNETGIRDATEALWQQACSSIEVPRTTTAQVQLKPQQVPDQSPSGGPGSTAKFITTTEELWDLLEKHDNKPVVTTTKTIGVYFYFVKDEGEEVGAERLFAVITGNASRDGAAVVLVLDAVDKALVFDGLKTMLEDPEITKVTFDVGRVARWIRHCGLEEINLEKCVDLQLFYKLLADPSEPHASMVQIVSHFSPTMTTDIANMVDTAANKMKSSATLNRLKTFVRAEQLFVRLFGVAFKNRAAREDELNRIFDAAKELWKKSLDLNGKQFEPFQALCKAPQQNVGAPTFKSHVTLSNQQHPPTSSFTEGPVRRTSSGGITYITTGSDLQHLLARNDNMPVEGHPLVVGVISSSQGRMTRIS